MTDQPLHPQPPQNLRVIRTYPQPDSPQPQIGPRERALAVYKYLMGTEPEQAHEHELYEVIVAAFKQSERQGWNAAVAQHQAGGGLSHNKLPGSLIHQLSSTTPAVLRTLQAPGH